MKTVLHYTFGRYHPLFYHLHFLYSYFYHLSEKNLFFTWAEFPFSLIYVIRLGIWLKTRSTVTAPTEKHLCLSRPRERNKTCFWKLPLKIPIFLFLIKKKKALLINSIKCWGGLSCKAFNSNSGIIKKKNYKKNYLRSRLID